MAKLAQGNRSIQFLLILGVILLLGGCLQPRTNIPPTACFTVLALHDYSYPPLEVLFDASKSTDPDGRIIDYEWNFGDGTTGSGATISHTYSSPGSYPIELTIHDNRGDSGKASGTVIALAIPDEQLLCRYEWEYEDAPQSLEVLFPQYLYQVYHDQPRHPLIGTYDYNDYVLEPRDDPTIENVAHALRERVAGDDIAFAQYALSFVQGGITYALDRPGFEYPLYPLETLVDHAGDCEDTTILYVSLLRALRIPVSMAFVDSDGDDLPDHVLALVPIPSVTSISGDCPPGTVPGIHEISGELFAIAETAADPLRSGYIPLGCDPWGIGPDAIKELWDF
jgi:hypothetical protein